MTAMLAGLLPRQAAAVTVAECLDQSHNPTAASHCQALIDDGYRSADIYLRLAEALNLIGKRAESYQRIEEGLKANPGNGQLTELKGIVRSNLSEQEYLDAQASKGPSQKATSKAKLRILRIKCLKKTGQEALDACDEFVALGGQDGEINQKRQSLLASQPVAPPAPKPIDTAKVPPPPEEPKSARVIELTPAPKPPEPVKATETVKPTETTEPTETAQQAKDREAYQRQLALVKQIQTALNNLGYQAGVPDGLTGQKTQNAVTNFYRITNIGPRQAIGQSLLTDLKRAQQLRSDALALHKQSRDALNRGDTTTARNLLNSAQQLASWVTPTDDLANQIDTRLASQQAQADNERKRQQASQQQGRQLMASAQAALDNGELDKARAMLTQAKSIDPSIDTRALDEQWRLAVDERSRLAQEQREADAQQRDKERVRKEATTLLTRARSELDNDRLEQATKLTQQARTLDPDLDETDLVVAEITRRQREIDAAREAEEKAATVAKDRQRDNTVATLLGNAQSELQANNPTAARAIAEEILALQPGNAEALNIINGRTEQNAAGQQRLAELLERGKVLLNARKRRNEGKPDYFTDAMPASIGQLFSE